MRFFTPARSRARRALVRALLASPLGAALLVHPAAASTTTGLPWETPLQTLQSSITGPVALAIALISIVVAGGTLVFGGDRCARQSTNSPVGRWCSCSLSP